MKKPSARKFALRLGIRVLLACYLMLTGFGQSTRSSLSGLLADQTGAAVSGAKVIAKHVTTNEEFQSVSDTQGAFVFPSLPLGQFSVIVEAQGFSNRSTFNQFNAGNNPAQWLVSVDQFRNSAGIHKRGSGVYFFNPNLLDITTNTAGRHTGSTVKDGLVDVPAPGTFGNFPINALTGPSFWQVDFSVSKRTKFLERADMEFKATFFNAFNHANFAYGNTQFDSANFGQITGQRGSPRIIHFILGINF